ncbi:NAD(P)/FAD-dependent oxidoreductase [Hymenobacter sp.]|uniref:NAD(P)/FAD-dependent oxidoreductase n=1 Tax=Hymenobacter sp. TaxID=1898978 RepID=UPI00286BF7D2|nr:NAD(P)/FAD-dependent oxidoreductase [Hymenobacter sp.]
MYQLTESSLNVPRTNKPRVVVIGGGFGAVNFVQRLPEHDFQVVMLSKQNYHGFWPLLYQVATASVQPESIAEPIRKLFRHHPDFHFRAVPATSVDTGAKTVTTSLGVVPYDYLIIATGTQANYFGNEQIRQHAFVLKDLGDAVNLRSQLLQSLEQANVAQEPALRQALLNIVIAGAGPTGVELAGSLSEMRRHVLPCDYPGLDFREMHIYLIDGASRVLNTLSLEASHQAQQDLEELGIIVKLDELVTSYDGQNVTLRSGEQIAAQTLVWAAGVTGALIEGLPESAKARGRYLVNHFSQVRGYEEVFAIGDVALMKVDKWPGGHPQVAQPAMQQGRHLASNFRRLLQGDAFEPFEYFNKGDLAVIGRSRAVGDLPGGYHLSGFVAWMSWLFVHIFFLIGFRNKVVVLIDWLYQLVTFQRSNRITILPLSRPSAIVEEETLHVGAR